MKNEYQFLATKIKKKSFPKLQIQSSIYITAAPE